MTSNNISNSEPNAMKNNHLLSSFNHNSHSTIELSIAVERLRQARYSFNLSIIATTISFSISLIGAGLLLSNKVPEGSATAAGGMVSSALCVQLAKDANDRLDKILMEIKNED